MRFRIGRKMRFPAAGCPAGGWGRVPPRLRTRQTGSLTDEQTVTVFAKCCVGVATGIGREQCGPGDLQEACRGEPASPARRPLSNVCRDEPVHEKHERSDKTCPGQLPSVMESRQAGCNRVRGRAVKSWPASINGWSVDWSTKKGRASPSL